MSLTNITYAIVSLALLSLSAQVYAQVSTPPLELLLNIDMIKHVIQSSDESSLTLFEGMNLTRYNTTEGLYIDDITVYVLPSPTEEFKLTSDFSTGGFFTVKTSSLVIKGSGVGYEAGVKTDGIAFEGHVEHIEIVFDLNKQAENVLGYQSIALKVKDFKFDTTNIRVVDAGAHKDLFEHPTEGQSIKKWINQEILRVALERIRVFE